MASPNRAMTIFEQRGEAPIFRIDGELAIFPARQTSAGSDPQTSITRTKKAEDPEVGQMHRVRRREEMHTIESKQTTCTTNPQLPILRLRDGKQRTREISLANAPCRVSVLGEPKA